jgi:anaerobic magnesium-protoporphyrin IX monomethyl ester cyclase
MAYSQVEMAFMFPPGGDTSIFLPHLGVAYIQAYLAKQGIASEQVIPPIGSTLKDCVDQLISTNARIIGFTCYDYNYRLVRAISSIVKRKRPDIIMIAGGPTATFSDQLLLTNSPEIDICVRFEGEETTLELISKMEEEKFLEPFEDIAGITYRNGDKIIRNPDRELFGSFSNENDSLDKLPSPYLEGILKGTENVGVLTARGCTQHCIYCNFSSMSKHTIRYHSIDRVVSELKYIHSSIKSSPTQDHDWRRIPIQIQDDNFTLNARRAKEICKRIIDEEIKLPLSCDCRPENIDEELIELLSSAGVSQLFFGLESSVPRVLRTIKRVRDNTSASKSEKEDYAPEINYLRKVKEGISLAKRHNMRTSTSIIIGLPGETLTDGLETIKFVRDLGIDFYSHNYLQIFAGTELFNTVSNYGLRVTSSGPQIPLEIQYAYPIHEIPILENSTQMQDMRREVRHVLKAFAGGPEACSGVKDGIIWALIERPNDNDFFEIFYSLSRSLAVGGRVFILGKKNDTIQDQYLIDKTRIDSGLPASSCCYLRSLPNPDSYAIYEIMNKPLGGRLSQWDPKFHLISPRQFLEFARKYDLNKNRPIYCLRGKDDLYHLGAIARTLNRKGGRSWLDGVFLDGCRWSRSICPAIRLGRIYVNKDYEVFPCLTGLSVGMINDDAKVLRENTARFYAKIRDQRKCGECPADSRCSKCLFTYPLSHQEYCEMQQANSGLSGIIERSKIANALLGI